jgi:multiple antibiotic resistance protein
VADGAVSSTGFIGGFGRNEVFYVYGTRREIFSRIKTKKGNGIRLAHRTVVLAHAAAPSQTQPPCRSSYTALAPGRGRAWHLSLNNRIDVMIDSLISDILFGFTGLISIINPVGVAFVFLDRTSTLTDEERRLLAKRVAINAFIVLLVTFFIGTRILHFFGISMEALRIGGGLAVAVAGWQMLNAPEAAPREVDEAGVKQVDAMSASSKAFFPLTVPLTTGPGSIATAIALNANRVHRLSAWVQSTIASVVISALVVLVIYYVYSRAARLSQYLGVEGTRVAMRVSSFLLLCIGVQIILTGLDGFLAPIASLRAAAK